MNKEERKCLNDCGFANVTQLLLAYVSLQQENARLKDKIEKVIDYANNDEFEDIEGIELGNVSPNGEYIISVKEEEIQDKINKLIKNQKKIIERLQHENSKDNV